MSKTEHTPGPWRATATYGDDTLQPFFVWSELELWAVAQCFQPSQAADPQTTQKANCLLLAAAPALAEALQACAESLAFARAKLGMCDEGDGKDHRADAPDDIGSARALAGARTALKVAGIE